MGLWLLVTVSIAFRKPGKRERAAWVSLPALNSRAQRVPVPCNRPSSPTHTHKEPKGSWIQVLPHPYVLSQFWFSILSLRRR